MLDARGRARHELMRFALKPAYGLYYRAVYDRTFRGSAALTRTVDRLESRVARGDTPMPKERWEEKYSSGGWEFMRGTYELPRYASIAALASRFRPAAAILDVGCGEGLLQDALRPLGYERYLGIDLAEAAIAQAFARLDERTRFVAADAEHFTTEERFDVVIFNECVHYFRDPVRTVASYESYLATGGLFIVSVFVTPRGEAIMRGLLRHYAVLEQTAISHRVGTSIILVMSR
jgi:SAM-dependent methyltransferase